MESPMNTARLKICGQASAAEMIGYDAEISIWNVDDTTEPPTNTQSTPHLRLVFDDIDFMPEDPRAPTRDHLEAALEFARRYASSTLLIYCHAGISRSTAVALAIIADRLSLGEERHAVNSLLAVQPKARVNLVLLSLADEFLSRDGRLREAWFDYENSQTDFSGRRRRKHMFHKLATGEQSS